MDTDSFVYEMETEDFYRYIVKDVKKRFGTSGYSKDENRPLPTTHKKVIDLMKDEFCGKIMKKIDKKVEEKRCKGTKKCAVAEGLMFDDCKTCLFDGKTVYREQMLFENKKHKMHTINENKIALNRDDDKRLL